jgi:outer membrane protein assembly factor BamD (BamD/ComL family)
MSQTGHIIRGAVLLGLLAIVFILLLRRSLKRAEDPGLLIFKWVLTFITIGMMIKFIGPMMQQGGYGAAFGGIPATAVGGLFLAVIWRKSLASMIANPIGGLYDGGDEEIEPKPLYSVAISKRKLGKHSEAIAEIWKQLEKFPNDFEGQMMLAEIQAEDLHDLPTAEMTIHRLCNQPGHSPRNLALALNSLADWYLKWTQDPEAARQALDKIRELLPDSEMSALAAQRIGHLANTEHLLGAHDRKKFVVPEGVQNLGLLDPKFHPKPAEADAAKQAGELVEHLRSHPLDTEARERLALIYAEHYNRFDLAADQFEDLIKLPNQPGKRVVQWLNRLADLQVEYTGDYETVRKTLQRITDQFPNSAAENIARNRIEHLKLELKGKQKNQAVKLGSYEQDIGLKRGLPNKL